MNQQNITPNSTERFVQAQYILSDGTIETYSNYMVSDHGRVGSWTNHGGTKRQVMKILKPRPYGKLGHLHIWLCANSKRYNRQVHRLVLSSFHPEQYFEGAEADHIDRNTTNNHLRNLRFVDHNGNNANRTKCPLKKIRVTYLNDSHVEEFDNMPDCSRAFGKSITWCEAIIRRFKGFSAKYNILIEKI